MEEKNNSTIFIITHKEFKQHYPNNYIPIQVGKEFTKANLGYISDDTKINIANKNKSYCELTGIYWVWKNYKIPEYIRFCHYRRYFAETIFKKFKIDNKEINKCMKKYDIILPKKFILGTTVWKNYYKYGAGKEKDLMNLKKIINEYYPKYNNSFEKIMKRRSASYCNMFVMKKEDFYEYCKWIFDILQKMEQITDLSNYTDSEKRIYRLLI